VAEEIKTAEEFLAWVRSWGKRTYGFEPRVNFSISIPISLAKRIQELARSWGLSRSATIAFLVQQGIARVREMATAREVLKG